MKRISSYYRWKARGVLILLLISCVSLSTAAAYTMEALSIPGDVNGDGVVNIDDIFFILGHWGEAGGPGDANGDGIVNIDDVFFILGCWT